MGTSFLKSSTCPLQAFNYWAIVNQKKFQSSVGICRILAVWENITLHWLSLRNSISEQSTQNKKWQKKVVNAGMQVTGSFAIASTGTAKCRWKDLGCRWHVSGTIPFFYKFSHCCSLFWIWIIDSLKLQHVAILDVVSQIWDLRTEVTNIWLVSLLKSVTLLLSGYFFCSQVIPSCARLCYTDDGYWTRNEHVCDYHSFLS